MIWEDDIAFIPNFHYALIFGKNLNVTYIVFILKKGGVDVVGTFFLYKKGFEDLTPNGFWWVENIN